VIRWQWCLKFSVTLSLSLSLPLSLSLVTNREEKGGVDGGSCDGRHEWLLRKSGGGSSRLSLCYCFRLIEGEDESEEGENRKGRA